MAYEIRMMVQGVRLLGDVFLGLAPYATDFKLRLFRTGFVPQSTDVLSMYLANEADFSGYVPQPVSGWVYSGIIGPRHTWTAASRTFAVAPSPTAGNSIGGYFVTFAGDTQLGWAQQLPGEPYAMTLFGHQIILQPLLTFRSEFA